MNPMAGMMMNPMAGMGMMNMGGGFDPAAIGNGDDDDLAESSAASEGSVAVHPGPGNVTLASEAVGSNQAPAVAPAAPEHVLPPDEDVLVHQRLGDALITRSATYLKNLGRNRLSDCLERMHGQLDATYTAELSRNGLLVLLWVFTRIKPSIKISDLRYLE